MDNTIAHRPAKQAAFVGKTGSLYVINPVDHTRYAKYPNVEAYNNRTPCCQYVDASVAREDFEREVTIGAGLRIES